MIVLDDYNIENDDVNKIKMIVTMLLVMMMTITSLKIISMMINYYWQSSGQYA